MTYKKKILVTRSSMPDFEEYCEEIKPLWESHWLTNRGALHEQFENALHSYLGVPNATLFVNGHSALECVLETMGMSVGERDEIITTPYTFVSTTHAIVRKGFKPVFADIKADDFTIDPECVENLITERTCAILPVHVYGNICDVDAIQSIADKYDLRVIYDAAHAFGVVKDGVPVGNFGDASMFSFHATKVFHSIEGGAITHNNERLGKLLSQWRNFGITGADHIEYAGGNAKLNEFSAAMGLCCLRHVDDWIAQRKIIAERYFRNLDGVRGLHVVHPKDGIRHNYGYMPVIFEDEFGATRDEVASLLEQQGIFARKYFYPLTSEAECYAGQFDVSATPVAKHTSAHVLTLPMYSDLSLADVDRICEIVVIAPQSCRKDSAFLS